MLRPHGNQIGKAGMISGSVVTPLQHQNNKNNTNVSQSHQQNSTSTARKNQCGGLGGSLVLTTSLHQISTKETTYSSILFGAKKHSSRLTKKHIWVFPKIMVPPNHPIKNRVVHHFHHPFWGPTPIFGNTHIYKKSLHSLFLPRIFQRFAALQLRWRGWTWQKPGRL